MPSVPAAATPPSAEGASSRSDPLYFPLPRLHPGQVLFRTTGAAEIHVGGSTVLTPSSERLFTIMVLCAMSPDHMMARSQLLELVWPDMDVKSARHTLRQQLYRLRQLGVPLTSNRTAVVLDAACLVPSFSLGRTTELFDRDVLRGQEPFGQLFAGWYPENPVLQRWVEQQRDRYHMDVRRVLLPELHRLRDRADWTECERWARTVLEFDPLNEDATLVLAEAIAMQGSRVDARYVLDGYARETGVAGTDLAQHVDDARRRISRATRVRFEHSATPTLIGRDTELQRLDALTLAALQGETKVVHILGPAGIGKTELAYEATRRAVILGFTRCIVRVTRPMGEVPFGTLSRLVRDLLRLPGALGCRPESLGLLRQLTGESAPEDQPAIEQNKSVSVAECLLELVAAISEEQPIVILVDDIHHVDLDSRTQLEHFEALAHKMNLLLLLTERTSTLTERTAPNEAATRSRIALGLLTMPAAQQLAEAVTTATGRRLRPHAAETIAKLSDRTPLHIISLAKSRLTEGISAPQSVKLREALTKQLHTLSVSANTAIKTLATLGGRSKPIDLDLVLELPLFERVAATSELIAAALVHEDTDDSLHMHDEVRSAVLDMMTQAERVIVSRRTAEVLMDQLGTHFEPERCDLALALAVEAGDWGLLERGCIHFSEHLAAEGWVAESLKYLRTATSNAHSDESRSRLLQVQLCVAQRAAAWQTAVNTNVDLMRLSATGLTEASKNTVVTLEASLRSELLIDGQQNAYKALAIACDSRTASPLRLRAARLAIGAASDLLDESLAVTAHAVLNDLKNAHPELNEELLESSMQFHAIFGDLSDAAAIALSLGRLGELGIATSEAARLAGNSAYVLRLAGETRLAIERFESILGSSRTNNTPGRRAFAAWQLSLIAAERDEALVAVKWNDMFRRIVTEQLLETTDNAYQQHQCRIELLLTGDIADPAVLLARIRLEDGRASRASLYSTGLALCSNAVLDDIPLRETLLDNAVAWISKFGRVAGQDILVLGAVKALEISGPNPRSELLLREYFGLARRERSNPNFLLRSLPDRLREIVTQTIAIRFNTLGSQASRTIEA